VGACWGESFDEGETCFCAETCIAHARACIPLHQFRAHLPRAEEQHTQISTRAWDLQIAARERPCPPPPSTACAEEACDA